MNIDMNDLVTIVNIIDICSERGAFKGNELVLVGTLREKIVNSVKEASAKTDGNLVDED